MERLRLAFWSKYLSLLKDHRPFEAFSSKDWIIRHMGEGVWKVMWEPLFRSKFGAYADKVSMTWFFGRIKARFGPSRKGVPQGSLGYLNGSTQVMVDALIEKLKSQGVILKTSTPVKKVLAENGRVTAIETKSGTENFDAILVTCSTPEFLESASGILPEGLRQQLADFKYYGSVVAVLELKRSLSPVYWLNILDPSIPFLAIIEQTKMIPPENYQGRHIVYLAKYLDTADPFFSLGNKELLADFFSHLKRVFPDFDEKDLIGSHVMRADYSQPIVLPGHGARLPPHRLPLKGLYLANMTQIYPEDRGMSYSIGMGRRVAKMMIEDAK
jgi:protoporphyrinogen oxidase